ncbi:AAA family ATPase [Streptomyces sp. NPDC015171]|uniref:helix-turn-helix transcriptional regulator n=1 Tax=Streptomyces sp. NPDC015171 TaxID=3364945 RepID=UPI0036F7B6AA
MSASTAPRSHSAPPARVPRHLRRELAVLGSVLTDLSAGRSTAVTVIGATGFGQDALTRWTSRTAEARGLRVLSARGTPYESGLRYGVVTQLLHPLTGPGADLPAAPPHEGRRDCPPGLTEVLRTARGRPTLVVVEDAQWLDEESLRWLHLLIRRAAAAPLAVLAGGCGVTVSGPDWREVTASPPAAVGMRELVLDRMARTDVADVVRDTCGVPGADAFLSAAHHASTGNPAVLGDTMRRFARRGHAPDESGVPELRTIGAAVLGDHVERGLRGLPAETVALLRALAVCGDLLDFPLVCGLAGLRHLGGARLRSAVEATGFVTTGTSGPRIEAQVRPRVLEEMSHRDRAELHARAAELAHRAAADDRAVAALLLGAGPVGAPWAAQVLRRAAGAARREGDHTRSIACLSRAVCETPDPAHRAELTFELAAAELVTAPEAGRRRLGALVRGPGIAPGLRVRALALALADGEADTLRRAAAEALPTVTGPERDDLIALFWAAEPAGRERTELMVPEVPALPDLPASPAQAGQRAWQLAVRGERLPVVRRLARAALAAPAGGALVLPRLAACRALFLTEDYEEAEAGLGTLLAALDHRDMGVALPRVLATRAELNLRRGLLAVAERDIGAAERSLKPSGRHPATMPQLRAVRVLVDLERGHAREARSLALEPVPRAAQDSAYWPHLLFARALAHAFAGEARAAAGLMKECGRQLLSRHHLNPALLPWRSCAARLLRRTGGGAEAERLSHAERRLAREWGTPGALGWAELNAVPDDGAGRLAGIRDAVRLLRNGPASPWFVRALAELAAAEAAQGGDRRTALAAVDELSVLTATHPHSPMAARTRLLAQRLEPAPRTPAAPCPLWAALTASEAATAVLAAHGHSNSRIAELLSVSRRTVELRLSRAYSKLRISGRQELRALVRARERKLNDAGRTGL